MKHRCNLIEKANDRPRSPSAATCSAGAASSGIQLRLAVRSSVLAALLLAWAIPSAAADPVTHAHTWPQLRALFASAAAGGGKLVIPPGDYSVPSDALPIALRSHLTVRAYGARFVLPEKLGRQARMVLFSGVDIEDFRWFGGHFSGNVFDPDRSGNGWEPSSNTRGIVVTTSAKGATANLTFRDITSSDMAGAVITVLGRHHQQDGWQAEGLARNVTVENCTLNRSGKFMWDYGYLWQITVWPEDYSTAERDLAAKYFPPEYSRGPVQMRQGDDRVVFPNQPPLLVSTRDERGQESLCFYGDTLPPNLVRGRQYFVVESEPDFIRIAATPGGEAIRFAGDGGREVRLLYPLFRAHLALYAPQGSGPGKGAIDLVSCQNVIVRSCRLSALGDAMHIQKSRDIVFSGNQITGARMGGFFLAEFCRNAVITGNTVDGTNGSRVMSVEKSCENVTVVGNTFRNGGRGSWINQPRNFVLSDNIFINNTTKCEPDPRRGRRSFVTGDYEAYAELYFTTYEPNGRYGNVTVRGNVFVTGKEAAHAITFAPGGDTLQVTDNIFQGEVRTIVAAAGCTNVTIRDNVDGEVAIESR
jgi:hypothetical protein